MYENEKGFIVVSGSQAKKELSSSITETYKALRQKLIDTNVLVDRGSHYEFTADTIFSSPSAAANMILGRQSNGLIEWVNSQNKTYKEINTFSQ